MKEERIGPHRLILGDCLEVMPTLGKVDAVRQPDLFIAPPPAPKQEAMDL